ncbi:MAG: hypothetical protein FWB88_07315 [Defluviitaleaceae bacterium]|nr:hypothetical protein [Defluviitaleaceae bacterium]MCL2239294.1 hypothetical protein [Defluviitaleaceae bacterium]
MKDNYDFNNMKRIPNRIAQRLGNKAKPALIDIKNATCDELDALEKKLAQLHPSDRQFYKDCCERKYNIQRVL